MLGVTADTYIQDFPITLVCPAELPTIPGSKRSRLTVHIADTHSAQTSSGLLFRYWLAL